MNLNHKFNFTSNPREPLVVFSPFLRSVLDSLSCCAKPGLSLPDCSSSALQHLWRIVQNGQTDFRGELNTSEIIVAAQCLQIDMTNFEYVKREPKIIATKFDNKNSRIRQTNLDAAAGGDESDSDLDETAVDDYGEDEDFNEDMETDDALSATKVNNEIDSFLKLKSQMQNLLDEDENDEQETLDEKAEDRSFTFNDGSNDSTSSGSNKVLQTCEVCQKKSRNLSYLWQHYCKMHFMKQLKTECERFVNVKTLKCEICQETLGNKQDLYMHVGIKHEKLNPILQKNGLNVLESLNIEPTETKPAKFRIPKKISGEIPIVANPAPKQAGQTAVPSSYQVGPMSNQQNLKTRPQMAPYHQPSSQHWTPALPMASQPPFRHIPPLNRPHHPGQMMQPQPMRAQLPPRQFNPQIMSTPPPRLPSTRFNTHGYEESLPIGQPLPPTPRPQPAGLGAQSATKPVQNPIPNPPSSYAPVASGQVPRTLPNQEIPGAAQSPGTISCLICQKTTPSIATLWQHYARMHFFAELKSDYSFMANIGNKSCNECGSSFKAVDALFLHIGTVHRKVNEIMEKKGLPCLEMPMNRTRKSM
jgi:hypothetical protein